MLYTYRTKRLQLKILGQEDAALTTAFFSQNREFFLPWESTPPSGYYTISYQRRVLEAEALQFLKSKSVRYYLFLPDYSYPIGTVSFRQISPAPLSSCQLGYRLGENFTGLGYMTEALSCLIPKIFFAYQLHRIESNVQTENFSSNHLMELLGFTLEGITRGSFFKDGHYQDCLRYSLLSDDPFPPKPVSE